MKWHGQATREWRDNRGPHNDLSLTNLNRPDVGPDKRAFRAQPGPAITCGAN